MDLNAHHLGLRFHVYLILLASGFVTGVLGDYQCLCSYTVEKTVYSKTQTNSRVIGYMYEFDCKPVYETMSTGSKFQSIMFEGKVGYIEMSSQQDVQTCPGDMSRTDIVIKTTLEPTTTTAKPIVTSTVTDATTTAKHTSHHHTTNAHTNAHITTATTQSHGHAHTNSHTTVTNTIMPFTSTHGPVTITTTVQSTTTTTTASKPPPSTTTKPTTASTTTSKMTTTTTAVPTSLMNNPVTTTPVTSTTTATTMQTTTPVISTTTAATTPTTTPVISTTTAATTPTTTPVISTTTATTKPTTALPLPSCPSGWEMHDTSCYFFHTGSRSNWNDALNYCSSHQSHLAIIESASEDHYLGNQLQNRIDTTPHHDADTGTWVAGTDDHDEGHWHWRNTLDGTNFLIQDQGYKNWHPGQPDAGEGKHGENCMTLIGNKGFEWQDYSCGEQMFFICEQPAMHLPPTTTQAASQQITNQPVQSTPVPQCSGGWEMHGQSCYLFFTSDTYEWDDANNYCKDRQSHLAIIETADEDHFIANQFSHRIDTDHDADDTGVWVAGNDQDTEGTWQWTDASKGTNSPMQGYQNWHPDEPDSGDGEKEEDCMCLIGKEGFDWQDYRCRDNMYFVCERSVYYPHGGVLVG